MKEDHSKELNDSRMIEARTLGEARQLFENQVRSIAALLCLISKMYLIKDPVRGSQITASEPKHILQPEVSLI